MNPCCSLCFCRRWCWAWGLADNDVDFNTIWHLESSLLGTLPHSLSCPSPVCFQKAGYGYSKMYQFMFIPLAAHSSTLPWRSPWTADPGEPQSMGLQRVRHDWATNTSLPCLTLSASPCSRSKDYRDHMSCLLLAFAGWLQAFSLTWAFLTFHFFKKASIPSNSKSFSTWFFQVGSLFIFIHSLLCFLIVLWISTHSNILTQMTSMPPLIYHPWTSWSLQISISEMLPNHLILCQLEMFK